MAFGRKKNNFNLLEVPKRFSMSKFVIHCEAHCQKFENSNLYISKILSALGGISLQICRFLFGNFGPFGLALLRQKKIHCFDGGDASVGSTELPRRAGILKETITILSE